MAKSFPNTGATVIDSSADLPTASAALEGILMFQKDTNELKICDGSAWVSMLDTDNKPMDAWTSYTPGFKQTTTITKTVNHAKYVQIGKTVYGTVYLTATGSGTMGGGIRVELPLALAKQGVPVGFGYFYDGTVRGLVAAGASDGNYVGFDCYGEGGGGFGAATSRQVVNGNIIAFSFQYETT